jgi:hypothetical protein
MGYDMKVDEIATGIADALAEGEAKKAKEVAVRMLLKGIPIENISDITGLSIDEIEKLR